ncbi:MAG: NPXTG-anchored protein, partial [Eubacterium sp.]|nr:NPXTG-anchored protein [Eubacterium sp.]
VKSGADVSAYKAVWLASVKAALDDGSLTGVGNLGLALCIMNQLDVDARNFEGYNLVDLFEKTDVSDNNYSAYNYMYATEAAAVYGLDDYAKALCDEILTYYTIGSGTDFWGGWGTTVDDLGAFIITLSVLADDYAEYIEDAFKLIETENTDEGYLSYGVANADSTAYALAAYSTVGNKAMADAAYDKLMLFYDNETGGFTAAYDEYYATADAIFGMEYYLDIADADKPANEPATEQPAEMPTEAPADGEVTEKDTESKAEEVKKSPATGAATGTALALAVMLMSGSAAVVVKKKDNQ